LLDLREGNLRGRHGVNLQLIHALLGEVATLGDALVAALFNANRRDEGKYGAVVRKDVDLAGAPF